MANRFAGWHHIYIKVMYQQEVVLSVSSAPAPPGEFNEICTAAIFFLIRIVGGGGGSPTGSTWHVGHQLAYCMYLARVIMRMENLVE
jgi:hypothetical protein